MQSLIKAAIRLTGALLFATTSASALPPQVEALNDFIKNGQHLSDRNCCFRAITDSLHNVMLVFYRPTLDYYEQKSLKYVSFDSRGKLRVAERTVLEEAQFLSLSQNESMITSDNNGNVHLVVRDNKRSFDKPFQTYLMIDSLGNLMKKIEFDGSSFLSSLVFL
jgi:hypothetical protein